MVRFITARQGIKINATTASGYTPLHQAAQQGHSTIVSHLLDKEADPNILTNVSEQFLIHIPAYKRILYLVYTICLRHAFKVVSKLF
jgi:ankyrin repeat protein